MQEQQYPETVSPADPGMESPAEPGTEFSAEYDSEPPAEPEAVSPAEADNESPAESDTEASAEPDNESPAEPGAESPAEPEYGSMPKPRAKQEPGGKERYFGSVRFFKNLIFLTVCILIAVPTVLAVKYYRAAASAAARSIPDSPAILEPEPPEPSMPPAEDTDPPVPAEEDAPSEALPLSADLPAYQELYPEFYAPQPYGATERVEGVVYLTFDDGPSARTDEILSILAEKDVKATFFVIGHDSEEDLQRLRDIAAQGHTVGMHSYSHQYSRVYASVEDFLGEFNAIFTEIRDTTGIAPTVFRFPGGSINGYNGGMYQELIAEMMRRGFVPYDWNVSSEDAVGKGKTAQQLVDNVMRMMSGVVRGFVLFHDGPDKAATVEALPVVIDRLREAGYRFAAITPETQPVLFPYES